jgi:nucleoside-diphosphate-sugar epimerase
MNAKNNLIETILVTGGMGFIGQNLCKELIKNYKVIVIDNYSSKAITKTFLFNLKKIKLIKCDISNEHLLNKKISALKFDAVIHAAAHFANQNSIDNALNDLKSNVLGTVNLLEICKKKNIKKFLYLSSSCVYGNNHNSNTEIANINPYETPYAISKYSAELYVKFYNAYYNINSVIIRIFNTYGPGELSHKYRNVIPKFIELALKNKKIIITGTGNETRDFTYITDTVSIIKKCLKKNLQNLEIFNSCTGRAISIKELANIIIKITKSKSSLFFTNKRNWDKVINRKGSAYKTKKTLNIKNFTSIKKGLVNTINWYKNIKNYKIH